MKEIKFRGKTKEDKWVYGSYVEYTDYKDQKEYLIYSVNGNPNNIIPKTVGQFTGLYDKNGKEIYEGDILQMKDRIVQVLWHEKAACWDCNFITYIAEPDRDFSLKGLGKTSWWKMYQVIGNIYDNPELIKE